MGIIITSSSNVFVVTVQLKVPQTNNKYKVFIVSLNNSDTDL